MSERDIFIAALKCPKGAERGAFLAQACGTQAELRQQIEALLDEHDHLGDFLDSPAFPAHAILDESLLEKPGTLVGPYKLLEQIGEGGMGLVFMADQLQPVRRRVALKIIKPGMDSRQVVARFEAERQALALMDHAHIAKIFDAGVTASGRPYFVMELVKGVPITEFCDQHRFSTRQRLELFVTVCQAVQHAHQKGVIHRDLKPGNLLVTLHDTVAVLKVIDFGIAKATTGHLTDRTLFTHFAQMVGTPLYMSPEQAEMNGLDVDTRSDVYALGVLLYELLTGTTPFESETLRKVGLDEMRRIIREDDPLRPSQRFSTLGAQACSTISERRAVDGRRLNQLLEGELDWIVMKALEKDRNRRYESASALAADVQRYLNDEAVEACPPSRWYRLRKYIRRNGRVLVPLAVIATVLVAATAVSTWQAFQANAARRLADERLDSEKKAQTAAATEAAIARAVNDFLQNDLLRQVNRSPQNIDKFGGNPKLTVKEALDRAAAKIGERFRDQPLVEAAVRTAIAEAYRSLWEEKTALSHLEKAVALRRASLGPNHPDSLVSMQRLAENYAFVGQSRDAVVLMEEVLGNYERSLGSDHPTTVDALSGLADACQMAGMWDRAIMFAEQVLEKRKTMFGPTHPSTVGAMHLLARIYMIAGFFAESIAWHEKMMAICNASPFAMKTYARALQGAGRLEEADCQLRKALDLERKLTDRRECGIGVAMVENILGLNLLLQERYAEAEQVARVALAILVVELPNDWILFHQMSMVGGALAGQQKYAEAEPFLVQGYEGMKKRDAFIRLNSKHWLTKAGDRLVHYYDVTNQPEKARERREKISVGKNPVEKR